VDLQSPLPRLRLERQLESGEDCLSPKFLLGEFRSRPDAALRPKDEAATGCSFLWLLSFEQAKESHSPKGEKILLNSKWIPACAGMTEQEILSLYD
jgi:hypothetical protein